MRDKTCFTYPRLTLTCSSSENRMRLPLEIIEISRAALPARKPLFIRISATDWHASGEKDAKTGEYISWGLEQSAVLLDESIRRGVDLMDVSSGGNDIKQQIKIGPGYQVSSTASLILCANLIVTSTGPLRGAAPRGPEARRSHPDLQRRSHHFGQAGRGNPPVWKGRPGAFLFRCHHPPNSSFLADFGRPRVLEERGPRL